MLILLFIIYEKTDPNLDLQANKLIYIKFNSNKNALL